jgi:hypothetical protein
MRQTISAMIAALAVVTAGAAPASACGLSACGYTAPVYSGCGVCGGAAYGYPGYGYAGYERLSTPAYQYGAQPYQVHQYYFVDQGPTIMATTIGATPGRTAFATAITACRITTAIAALRFAVTIDRQTADRYGRLKHRCPFARPCERALPFRPGFNPSARGGWRRYKVPARPRSRHSDF